MSSMTTAYFFYNTHNTKSEDDQAFNSAYRYWVSHKCSAHLGNVCSVQESVPFRLLFRCWILSKKKKRVKSANSLSWMPKLLRFTVANSLVTFDSIGLARGFRRSKRLYLTLVNPTQNETYLQLLGFVDTLLIAADIKGIFHIEQLVNISLLRRHVEHNTASWHVAQLRHFLAVNCTACGMFDALKTSALSIFKTFKIHILNFNRNSQRGKKQLSHKKRFLLMFSRLTSFSNVTNQ